MNFAISWVLGLFKKPEIEVTFEKAELTAWPFPAEKPKRKPRAKKPVVKKATKVAVKKTVAKKKAKAKR